jgi:DNA-binding beta-propeller fold protein YncE
VNPGTNTASRIAADHSVLDSKAGMSAGAIAVNAKGDMALAVGLSDKTLAVFSATAGQAHLVNLPSPSDGPGSIALTPGDRLACVTHPGDNLLSLLDSRALQILATIPTPAGPGRIIVTSDSKFACVACQKGDSVFLVDLTGLIGA